MALGVPLLTYGLAEVGSTGSFSSVKVILPCLAGLGLIGAFAWYGLTALFWFYILTRVPLSLAYPFSIVGSGLVPLVAWLVFKEPLDWRFAVGYLLMLTGFAVIMQGQKAGLGG